MNCCHLNSRLVFSLINGRQNDDKPEVLSSSFFLQGLLKKVYQESCRILTLSQRQAAPSAQPHVSELKGFPQSRLQYHSEGSSAPMDHRGEAPPSDPPMTWQQEKRALQETVIALRELLCRMAQRQVSFHPFIWMLSGKRWLS